MKKISIPTIRTDIFKIMQIKTKQTIIFTDIIIDTQHACVGYGRPIVKLCLLPVAPTLETSPVVLAYSLSIILFHQN